MPEIEPGLTGDQANGDVHLSWIEQAVLLAIGIGVPPDEIIGAVNDEDGGQTDRGTVDRAIAGLLGNQLLRRSPDDVPPGYVVTARGQRIAVSQAFRMVATARVQEEERAQMERLRTDLLSTVSHELRTPLTLIRTSIGLLLDSEPDGEMKLRLLRNIKLSTDRMHELVTDLLDLARLRQDRLDLNVRSVDLEALVTGAVSLMRPLLDAREQRIDLVTPARAPVIPGDFRRLERVLLNILNNANKFAPAGSTIAVTIDDRDTEAVIAVQDAGPGIAAGTIPHLFEQFFTERTSSSRHNIGAGLGLPIAKGIVEAHGGRIWVESTVGTGTTVSFALPKVSSREVQNEDLGS